MWDEDRGCVAAWWGPSGSIWDLVPLEEGSLGQGGKPWFSGQRLSSLTPHTQGGFFLLSQGQSLVL